MKPQRMCAACRKVTDKNGLIRIAKIGEDFLIDITNKSEGRGAYICKSEECILNARKKKVFERSFKTKFPSVVYDNLEAMVLGK